MLAFINSHHVWFILSKIEGLAWVNLVPHGLMKVHVADLAIAIHIKLFEDVLELFFSKVQPPILQIESQLIFGNRRIPLFVHVAKGLADSFPLKLDFVYYRLFQCAIHQIFCSLLFAPVLNFLILTLPWLFEWRILNGVVSKIEPLALMNRIADPLAEICIAKHPSPSRVLVCDELFQIVKVEFLWVLAKISEDIFNRNETIIIGVQSEESLADRVKVWKSVLK